MNETFFLICDLLGTLAFSISGIRLASAKRFDLFGAFVVGLATAVGGGTIRDLMLHIKPLWLLNPTYLLCNAIGLIWVITFRKILVRQNNTWFLFDTIGLAVFTITGMEKALQAGFPVWTAIIMGSITGAGGGVIRDVLINEVPLIFRQEIYALACVLGGIGYWGGMQLGLSPAINTILCAVLVITIRLLAVKFKLGLPILKGELQ